MRRARKPLPQTTIGSDSAIPKATRVKSPWAAAATARTLSRLIVTSATTMIQTACRKEAPWRTSPSPPSPGRTSLTAIQSSSSPPTNWSSGIVSSALTIAIKSSRSATAAAVPHTRPSHCSRAGSERTASAMTSALSPASERSMSTMLTSRAQNSGSVRNVMPEVLYREYYATDLRSPPRQPPAHAGQDGGKRPGHRILQSVGRRAQPAHHGRILEDHVSRHVAQQSTPGPDDPRVAIHQPGEDPATPHHDRHRHADAERDEEHVAVGGRRHHEHVVEAHGDVRHHDDPDRLPEGGRVPGAARRVVDRPDQLERDPDQQEASGQPQVRHAEQQADHADKEQPQDDGPRGPAVLTEESLAWRQRANRQRDDHCVVPREQQVEKADLGETSPELRRPEDHRPARDRAGPSAIVRGGHRDARLPRAPQVRLQERKREKYERDRTDGPGDRAREQDQQGALRHDQALAEGILGQIPEHEGEDQRSERIVELLEHVADHPEEQHIPDVDHAVVDGVRAHRAHRDDQRGQDRERDPENGREERHEGQHHHHPDDVAGVHARDEAPDEVRPLAEQHGTGLQAPDDEPAQHHRRGGAARDAEGDHGQQRSPPRRVGRRLRRHHPLDLALAEALGVFGEALSERVAHERGGGGAARLEAHPEADEGAADERAIVARQYLPRLPDHLRVHLRLHPAEGQPLLHREQDLADAEEADDGHDEVEALHQLGDPEGQAELAGHDVEAGGGEDEAEQDRHQRLERVAAAQTDERRERQKLDREELGGPELQRDLGEERGEQGDQDDREEGADERRGEGGGECLPALPLARHRIAVEGGGHRPRLARDIEEDRGDGPTEERPPVEAREQDDGGGRRHREGEREQDGHPVGPAEPGQHADHGAERDAEDGEPEIVRLQRHLEAEEQVLESHAQYPSQDSSGPLGIGTRNHFSKTTKITSGNSTLTVTTATQG